MQKIKKEGFLVLLAGGAVRDLLLKKPPGDLDLSTEASPDEILKIFPQGKDNFKKHLVIFLALKKGVLEIVSFRKEKGFKDGRRPELTLPASLKEDASRRDFTVNALYYDPFKEEILDFTGGLEDLKKKVLRACGDPKTRFEEDFLRPLRALRLAHQLDFKLNKKIKEVLPDFKKKILKISKERVLQEIEKMLSFGRVDQVLKAFKHYEFYPLLFKELGKTPPLKFFWNKENPHPKDIALSWSFLLLPFFLKKEEGVLDFLKRWPFSSKRKKEILGILKGVKALCLEERKALVFKALHKEGKRLVPLSLFYLSMQKKSSLRLKRQIKEFETHFEKKWPRPKLKSSDLMKKAIKKSDISSVLSLAFEYQLEQKGLSKAKLLALALKASKMKQN